ncbi:MAG: hypothetical protein HZB71_11855 [Betaproteobacteria bacterium]|nr:hypothetical protein [Betaproteobacteria bacterium]
MAMEIMTVGLGPPQSVVHSGSAPYSAARNSSAPQNPRPDSGAGNAEAVFAGRAGFASLSASNDDAGRAAQSVRAAGRSLEKVAQAVHELKDSVVTVIKNYPPFPQGDQKRAEFLNSINGLRQQLAAMTVPPAGDSLEPVIYPREYDLPFLNPDNASEEELQAFSRTLDEMEAKVMEGFADLKALVDKLPKKINADLTLPLNGDDEAGQVSHETGGKIGLQRVSLLGDSSVLTSLGG